MRTNNAALVEAYFKMVLNKDPNTQCWTEEEYKEYAALKLLYQKHGNGRTEKEFLRQVLGGRK